MKVGVIIPTRGDRPEFLAQCKRLLGAQTCQPDIVEIVDYSPRSNEKDISQRYRFGYLKLRAKGLDVIALMEDDEYYAPDYLETMITAWEKHGRPNLFGTSYTIYYHIRERGYFYFQHSQRSSAMSTLIKPDLDFAWPFDQDPYFDAHVWIKLKDLGQDLGGIIFKPEKHICIGIKHGTGLCGGGFHTDYTQLQRFTHSGNGFEDPEGKFLKSMVDAESFKFYNSFFLEERQAYKGR